MDYPFLNNDQEVENQDHADIEVDLLLEGIFRLSGFDFRQYNRSSITRRIYYRMKMDNIPTITRLLERVIHEEAFLEQLLNDFSINVTEMFRNPSFFVLFRAQIIPHLRNLEEIRIWHAGCATGEEVFSMAILLEEEGLKDKTVIYATDMNETVLEKASKVHFLSTKCKHIRKIICLLVGRMLSRNIIKPIINMLTFILIC